MVATFGCAISAELGQDNNVLFHSTVEAFLLAFYLPACLRSGKGQSMICANCGDSIDTSYRVNGGDWCPDCLQRLFAAMDELEKLTM